MTKEKFLVLFTEQFDKLSDDVAVALHNEYCDDNGYSDDLIISTDDFDTCYENATPTDIVFAVRCGDYNPNDDWFQFDGYANPVSSYDPHDFMDIESIGEWAYENEIDLSNYGIEIDLYDDDCGNDDE